MFIGCIMQCYQMIELHAMLAYVGSEDGQDWDKNGQQQRAVQCFWLGVLAPASTLSQQQHVCSKP